MSEQERIRLAAFAISSAFEGGRGYANYQNYDRGIVSYGRFQFTLSSGSLGRVLGIYFDTSTSAVSDQLRAFRDRINVKDEALRHDDTFKALLIEAAEEDEMRDAQDAITIRNYWAPSQDSASVRGIETPLSQALLFDMAIQHGPMHMYIQRAEAHFGVSPKSRLVENGITEVQLISQTAIERRDFLHDFAERNNFPGVKARGDFWVNLTTAGDWQLHGDDDGNVSVFSRAVQVRNPDPLRIRTTTIDPGEAISGVFIARTWVQGRKEPDITAEKSATLDANESIRVTRRYDVSDDEVWFKSDQGWFPLKHPSTPGAAFATVRLDG
ncbi:MAG: chitosanase [Anaerolineae bacterium]|nr:chitosanase [Anaerolineae bacterium]